MRSSASVGAVLREHRAGSQRRGRAGRSGATTIHGRGSPGVGNEAGSSRASRRSLEREVWMPPAGPGCRPSACGAWKVRPRRGSPCQNPITWKPSSMPQDRAGRRRRTASAGRSRSHCRRRPTRARARATAKLKNSRRSPQSKFSAGSGATRLRGSAIFGHAVEVEAFTVVRRESPPRLRLYAPSRREDAATLE